MAALNEIGVATERFEASRLSRYSAIVVSKTFSVAAAKIVRSAKASNVPVITDICDNVFELATRRGKFRKRDRIYEQMNAATLISVATPVLGDLVTETNPAWRDKIRVIPDALEELPDGPASWLDRYHLRRLRAFLDAHPKRLHCIWFGLSSDNVSGLAHLSRKLSEIGSAIANHPITITVVSNDRRKYRSLSPDWPAPSYYVPWKLNAFAKVLRLHKVALVPVQPNSFTIAKTINRPATALANGLGVIADAIESYEELRPFLFLDDWCAGLRHYALDWDGQAKRLLQARAHLHARYGSAEVARQWRFVLSEAAAAARSSAWHPPAA